MGRVGRARSAGLGLQRGQAPAAQGRAQVLAAHPVAFFPQRHLEPAGAVAAFRHAEYLHQRRCPGRRFALLPGPLLVGLPGVKAAGGHAQHLAEPLHGVVAVLGGDEAVAAP